MNILLIFPPSTIYGKDPTIPSVVLPLGLAYIAAYLEREHYKVSILDARSLSKDRVIASSGKALYGLTDEELRIAVKNNSPDIVGISCMYTAYSADAHRVAKIVKGVNRDIPVLMGGAYASAFPDVVMKDNNVDAVVHAEGEETFLALVKRVENKKDFSGVAGATFRDSSGSVVVNPARDFIKDLDSIPFPARHLLDMSLYLEKHAGPYAMRAPSSTIITSRGCPNACAYCTIKFVWGSRRWRGRSAVNVVDEMALLYNRYGVREFQIMDDSAGTSKVRLQEICREILKRGLDIKWTTPNGIAHWFLDEETLRLMKKAGCYRITFGIESGNIHTRVFIGKPFPLEQAKRMMRFANNIGMWTICTFIIGFAFETEEAIMDTVDFACNSGTDMAVFYLLCPHPGTKVYEVFKNEGLLNLDTIMDPTVNLSDKDFEEIGLKLTGRELRTRYFGPEEIQRYLGLAYKNFFKASLKHFLNPLRIVRKIRNPEDLMYTLKICKMGTGMAFANIFKKTFMSQDITAYRKKGLEIKKL